jgi:hypothetical protein
MGTARVGSCTCTFLNVSVCKVWPLVALVANLMALLMGNKTCEVCSPTSCMLRGIDVLHWHCAVRSRHVPAMLNTCSLRAGSCQQPAQVVVLSHSCQCLRTRGAGSHCGGSTQRSSASYVVRMRHCIVLRQEVIALFCGNISQTSLDVCQALYASC